MATLKVQSVKDIAEAYLKSLGFAGENLSSGLNFLMKNCFADFENGDVAGFLDALLLKNILQNYAAAPEDDERKLALFKAVFLFYNGAEKWGAAALTGHSVPDDLQRAVQANYFCPVPECRLSFMQPQKIESVKGKMFFKRMLRFFRKR